MQKIRGRSHPDGLAPEYRPGLAYSCEGRAFEGVSTVGAAICRSRACRRDLTFPTDLTPASGGPAPLFAWTDDTIEEDGHRKQ